MTLSQHYTQAICTPTRGALLTGRYPIHTGTQHHVVKPGQPWGLPLEETTLPQILKEYNYSTHAVGKWHLGFHKWAYTPVYRGFDAFLGMYQGSQDYLTHYDNYRKGGLDLRSDTFDEDGRFVEELRWDLHGQYSAEFYSQHTIDLIWKHKTQETPFFIYLAYQNVHNPHQVPQQYIDKYSSHFNTRDQQVFGGMVSAMDEGIGNITAALRDSGLGDNTIVVFTSDNGGNSNCLRMNTTSSNFPYRGGKKTLYEGGIRTPTIVWAPNRVLSGETNAMVHITDWLPTLWSQASLQGQLKPNNPIKTKPLDGIDQWQVISGQHPPKRQEFIINIDPSGFPCGHEVAQSAVRWRDWKLIIGGGGPPFGWYPNPDRREYLLFDYTDFIELYNIRQDPSERRNVHQRYPEIVKLLRSKLSGYNRTAVPPRTKPYDPASDPKYFNNTWMPWREESLVEQNFIKLSD